MIVITIYNNGIYTYIYNICEGCKLLAGVVKFEYMFIEKSLDAVLNLAIGTRRLTVFSREFKIRRPMLLKHLIDTCFLPFLVCKKMRLSSKMIMHFIIDKTCMYTNSDMQVRWKSELSNAFLSCKAGRLPVSYAIYVVPGCINTEAKA